MDDDKEFDLEDVYDSKIAPLMAQIIDICKDHSMPMAATFQHQTDMRCTSNMGFDRESDAMRSIMHAMQPRRTHWQSLRSRDRTVERISV